MKPLLDTILHNHELWLNDTTDGVRADLRRAYLTGADLRRADLRRAVLTGADLRRADLRRADLTDAYLTGADLRRADLTDADLTGADLRRADLTDADLTDADLTGADLIGADLRRAVLTGAKGLYYPMACPTDGAFVGWKKAYCRDARSSAIVKLMIYDDARRSSATGRKCRCDKAKVLAIYDMSGNEIAGPVCSIRNNSFVYTIGETVTAPDFDENRWHECSAGIHFFITREEAERYDG